MARKPAVARSMRRKPEKKKISRPWLLDQQSGTIVPATGLEAVIEERISAALPIIEDQQIYSDHKREHNVLHKVDKLVRSENSDDDDSTVENYKIKVNQLFDHLRNKHKSFMKKTNIQEKKQIKSSKKSTHLTVVSNSENELKNIEDFVNEKNIDNKKSNILENINELDLRFGNDLEFIANVKKLHSCFTNENKKTAKWAVARLNHKHIIEQVVRNNEEELKFQAAIEIQESPIKLQNWNGVLQNSKLLERFSNEIENFTKDEKIALKKNKHAREFYTHIKSYEDMIWVSKKYLSAIPDLRRSYVLHTMNHLNLSYKASKRYDLASKKLAECDEARRSSDAMVRESARESESILRADLERFRDQGFARARVLILLPFRAMAYDLVNLIVAYAGGSHKKDTWERFKTEFGQSWETERNNIKEENEKSYDEEQEENRKRIKPADHRATFAGNSDDCFQIGIKLSREAARLYTPHNDSDIIIASPLGLRTTIDADPSNVNLFSGIEILIIDGAHVMYMQNWNQVEFILEKVSALPIGVPSKCDFARVHPWALDGMAKLFRQTIIFSEFVFPDLNGLTGGPQGLSPQVQNLASPRRNRLVDDLRISVGEGSMRYITTPCVQRFERILSTSPILDADTRFQHFVKNILPRFTHKSGKRDHWGVLLFVPSYLDFVRIRNYFDEEEMDFEETSEYSTPGDRLRSRNLFAQGRTSILVYTERLHYFRRLVLRGVQNVIFYGLPDNARFYPEIVNLIGLPPLLGDVVVQHDNKAPSGSVTVLHTPWDALKLERVVGSKTASRLLSSESSEIFDFAPKN